MTAPRIRTAVCEPGTDPAYEHFVTRVFEGDPLPAGACFLRLIATEDVPWGTGTATRRLNTLLLARAEADRG